MKQLVSDIIKYYLANWQEKTWLTAPLFGQKLDVQTREKKNNTWPNREKITDCQKEIWSQDKRLIIAQLSNEDIEVVAKNEKKQLIQCMKLLEADGLDGQPVGVSPLNTIRNITLTNAKEKRWLTDQEVIRFGIFCHLDFFTTIYLVIKNQFEQYLKVCYLLVPDLFEAQLHQDAFSDIIRLPSNITRFKESFQIGFDKIKLSDSINLNRQEGGILKAGTKKITADIPEIYNMFRMTGYYAELGVIDDVHKFISIIEDYMSKAIYCEDLASDTLLDFIESQTEKIVHLLAVGANKQDEYFAIKFDVSKKTLEFQEALLALEKERLRIKQVEMEWYRVFGRSHLDLVFCKSQYDKLAYKLKTRKENPALSLEEIKRRIIEDNADREMEVLRVRSLVKWINSYEKRLVLKSSVDLTQIISKENHVKKLLHRNWKLTHRDMLHGLTEEQMKKFDVLYFELNTINEFRKADIVANEIQVKSVLEIEEKIKTLYHEMGLEWPKEDRIATKNIHEDIEYLERELEYLKRSKDKVMLKKLLLPLDPNFMVKEQSLTVDAVKEDLFNQQKIQTEECKRNFIALLNECKKYNILEDGDVCD